jgi:hypothetical protein
MPKKQKKERRNSKKLSQLKERKKNNEEQREGKESEGTHEKASFSSRSDEDRTIGDECGEGENVMNVIIF